MRCPNCDKKMKKKEKYVSNCVFHTGPSADDEDTYRLVYVYKCKDCGIKIKDGKTKVPKELRPSDKQINTILFINNRLGTNFEPITKKDAWDFINKYFDKAKNTKPVKKRRHSDISLFLTDDDDDFLERRNDGYYYYMPTLDEFFGHKSASDFRRSSGEYGYDIVVDEENPYCDNYYAVPREFHLGPD